MTMSGAVPDTGGDNPSTFGLAAAEEAELVEPDIEEPEPEDPDTASVANTDATNAHGAAVANTERATEKSGGAARQSVDARTRKLDEKSSVSSDNAAFAASRRRLDGVRTTAVSNEKRRAAGSSSSRALTVRFVSRGSSMKSDLTEDDDDGLLATKTRWASRGSSRSLTVSRASSMQSDLTEDDDDDLPATKTRWASRGSSRSLAVSSKGSSMKSDLTEDDDDGLLATITNSRDNDDENGNDNAIDMAGSRRSSVGAFAVDNPNRLSDSTNVEGEAATGLTVARGGDTPASDADLVRVPTAMLVDENADSSGRNDDVGVWGDSTVVQGTAKPVTWKTTFQDKRLRALLLVTLLVVAGVIVGLVIGLGSDSNDASTAAAEVPKTNVEPPTPVVAEWVRSGEILTSRPGSDGLLLGSRVEVRDNGKKGNLKRFAAFFGKNNNGNGTTNGVMAAMELYEKDHFAEAYGPADVLESAFRFEAGGDNGKPFRLGYGAAAAWSATPFDDSATFLTSAAVNSGNGTAAVVLKARIWQGKGDGSIFDEFLEQEFTLEHDPACLVDPTNDVDADRPTLHLATVAGLMIVVQPFFKGGACDEPGKRGRVDTFKRRYKSPFAQEVSIYGGDDEYNFGFTLSFRSGAVDVAAFGSTKEGVGDIVRVIRFIKKKGRKTKPIIMGDYIPVEGESLKSTALSRYGERIAIASSNSTTVVVEVFDFEELSGNTAEGSGTWEPVGEPLYFGVDADFFGEVSLSGDGYTLAVGFGDAPSVTAEEDKDEEAKGNATEATGEEVTEQSTVYIHRFDGSSWTDDVSALHSEPGDDFGRSVALTDNGFGLIVGSPKKNVDGIVDSGVASVYELEGATAMPTPAPDPNATPAPTGPKPSKKPPKQEGPTKL